MIDYMQLVGGVIAFAGLIALLFGFGDKRQCHKELAGQSIQLSGGIAQTPVRFLARNRISGWERCRTSIDLKEPPGLKALVAKCEWEQALAEGHKDTELVPPGFFRQLTMHFI